MAADDDLIARERDLYRCLLELGEQADVAALLDQALRVVVEGLDATFGFLALSRDVRPGDPSPWSRSFSQDSESSASRTVIGRALQTGEVQSTNSAAEDPKLSAQTSVRTLKLEAILAVPLALPGEASEPFGVLYAHRSLRVGGFDDAAVARARLIAAQLAPIAWRFRSAAVALGTDPTQRWRERVRAERLVGVSDALAQVLRKVAVASSSDGTVLVTGPTGCGKSEVARAVWASSARSDQPFEHVDCGVIAGELFRAALFGAREGSFTGASHTEGHIERIERGGVLFLDEIGNLTGENQAALLRFLDAREFQPVGAPPRKADVRVVAATNAPLERLAAEGGFRADLLARLSRHRIRVPPLDARPEDLPVLVTELAERLARQEGAVALPLTSGAVAWLSARRWPGNVRELENVVADAMAWARVEGAVRVEVRHLADVAATDGDPQRHVWKHDLHAFKRRWVERLLARHDHDVRAAAEEAQVSRSQLYAWIGDLGLSLP